VKAVIYINTQLNTVTKLDQQRTMSAIIAKHIPAANIIFVNVSCDYNLQSKIVLDGNGKRGYPQAYIGDERIGLLDEVKEADRSGLLEEVCKRGMSSSLNLSYEPSSELLDSLNQAISTDNCILENPNPGETQSTISSWISATAWLAAVGNLFSAVVGSVSGTSNVEKSEENDEVLESQTIPTSELSVLTFDIKFFRSNWYYRSQERLYRFLGNSFTRVDPATNNVCAEFSYDNVDSIIQSDKNNVVIKFKDLSEEQHLWTDNAKNIDVLMDTITSRTSTMEIRLALKVVRIENV